MTFTLMLAGALLGCAGLTRPEPPDRAAMDRAWNQYTRAFVNRNGRVVDPSPEGELSEVTTSEGQSYAMLRAAWMGDRRTFKKVMRWTEENLQGGDYAALPAWKWGPSDDGSWGVLDPQPAADSDQLIAYALLIAWRRWGQEEYKDRALGLMASIWAEEVDVIGPYTVMLPGPWAKHTTPAQINPSYFLPFAWRAFAEVDPDHDWSGLLRDSYTLLDASLQPSGLPPDWCWLDRETGALVEPPPGNEGKMVFGFEAFRVAWNLAADAQWYGEPRAHKLLAGFDGMHSPWERTGKIPALIDPDGTAQVDWEYPGLYGGLLPAWGITRPEDARLLYAKNIVPERGKTYWAEPDAYYTQNWIWFGLALWTNIAMPPEHYQP